MITAKLKMLGVEALMIDKFERMGGSWRTRYHRLVLHDPCWSSSMPYLAYPALWPVYASKDKMGDFHEVRFTFDK
jgi:cation diffusion facilitator CzcD-associated flavoprotein CzcO